MLYTFCILSAILWLCYRLYKFLGIPVSKIVLTLKIRTPPATKVSIDRVNVDSITIHWENEPVRGGSSPSSSSSISHYLLYLNNLQVAVFPNSPNSLYTCCSITGLKPETEHQLDFITVNRMGFMNKLPSIYCMTKSNNTHQTVKKSGEWRKNTLTTLSQVDSPSLSNSQVTESNQSTVQPAYANLTTLKDLESFSIEDLKKILICAQEDLHDVLSQQSSLLQDFQESKLQWELELENLKTHWSHEIDLRKSLKSTIKSLENSKLLYDLKLEKLKKNIDQSKSKIAKMKKDMQSWSLEESQQLNGDTFRRDFSHAMKRVQSNIEDLTGKIKSMQGDISVKEEDNKRLNTLKKSSTSNASMDNTTLTPQVASAAMEAPAPSDVSLTAKEVVSLQGLLKKINEQTVERTGQLTPVGEEMLGRINSNSQLVNLIREQIKLDQELDNKWKVSRTRMVKRLETLEAMFTDISLSNRQMRASLMVQPYAQKNSDSRNSNSNAASTITLNEQSPALSSPPMTHLSVPNDVPVAAQPPTPSSSNPHHLVLHNPSTYASEDPHITGRAATVSPVTVAVNATASTTRPTLGNPSLVNGSLLSPQISGSQAYADPSLLMSSPTPVQSFSWATEPTQNELHAPAPLQGQSPQRQLQSELDQPFEYDNASHLISGLRDMIYDETDSPDSISGYSKGFTTDQLDNYWTNQTTRTSARKDTKPTAPSLLSYGGGSLGPSSPSMAGTGFSDSTPMGHSDSFSSVNNNLGATLMSHPDDPMRARTNPPQSQGRFASRFNFLWHSGHATSPEPSSTINNMSGNNNEDGSTNGVAST
ncbi:ZYRO0F05456p [Zygosaccharomyces rouxii]|uniref:ZYRO0F05456p n=1 Tax=Zygosaccharomyces rouxii (strain ATCC 2623 / CBS 732 / NBRC 1130 / NCYC 568 / NRRL Y-229) TaxID=559307 RepID=C5DXI9_ZYGRC|nr:uncharacterized protein ZYRO0F05456g [Zygosaccharomyces rouxii]KAH9199262.1 hypothetical protein LQ764DRAFT_128123 [Zygosaccharomyces rouxii]CAR28500.1 ZYRO0F05456p [Zygosaccharomyces rouxii]